MWEIILLILNILWLTYLEGSFSLLEYIINRNAGIMDGITLVVYMDCRRSCLIGGHVSLESILSSSLCPIQS